MKKNALLVAFATTALTLWALCAAVFADDSAAPKAPTAVTINSPVPLPVRTSDGTTLDVNVKTPNPLIVSVRNFDAVLPAFLQTGAHVKIHCYSSEAIKVSWSSQGFLVLPNSEQQGGVSVQIVATQGTWIKVGLFGAGLDPNRELWINTATFPGFFSE